MHSISGPRSEFERYMVYNSVTKMYTCTLCQRESIARLGLLNHIESRHFPNSYVYTCVHCAKEFNNKNSMSVHVSRVHNKKLKKGGILWLWWKRCNKLTYRSFCLSINIQCIFLFFAWKHWNSNVFFYALAYKVHSEMFQELFWKSNASLYKNN